jgi:hypothetical protein
MAALFALGVMSIQWMALIATLIAIEKLLPSKPTTRFPAAQAALDSSIYQVRVQRATDAERRYMRAMAELGPGPYRSGNVARKAGRSTTALSQVRQRLLDKGLIYATEDYGHVDFTIPRFDEFMRRHMPYHAPKRRRGTT